MKQSTNINENFSNTLDGSAAGLKPAYQLEEDSNTNLTAFYNALSEFAKQNTSITVQQDSNPQESDLIKKIQIGLQFLGYSLPQSGADGKFGNETASALLKFQNNESPDSFIANSEPNTLLPYDPYPINTQTVISEKLVGTFSDFIKLTESLNSVVIDSKLVNSLINKLKEKSFSENDLIKYSKPIISNNKLPDSFYDALGQRESSNDYREVNQLGYLGKYQFGLPTLKWLGFNVNKDQFLNDPNMQEAAVRAYVKKNQSILQPEIQRYANKPYTTVDGKTIYITEPGILAGAHLGGAGSVRKFFNTQGASDPQDANGTSVAKYMEEFSHTKLV